MSPTLAFQSHSFTTSVVPNILIAVPSKKEKLPLSVTHPELAKEADGWDPSQITFGSEKLLTWKCNLGHTFKTSPASRTKSQSARCQVCTGVVVLPGFNDLSTTHPDLAAQAHEWNPTEFSFGSGKLREWKCEFGHIWEARIYSRRTSGCPVCSGRLLLTGFNDLETKYPELAKEAEGWDPASTISGTNRKLKWKCSKCGYVWETSANQRISKGRGCAKCSHQVVTTGVNDLATLYPNIALEANGWEPALILAHSSKKLSWKCQDYGHIYDSKVANRTGLGRGCPVCAGQVFVKGFNDLATTHPELAKSALGWDPSEYGYSDPAKMSWRCEKVGHTFVAQINNRAIRNDRCPICSGKEVLVGFNDLRSQSKELASEASGWDPETVTISSGIRKRWLCSEGHSWMATPANRTNGTGCPECAKFGFNPGADGHLYLLVHADWEMLQIGITNVPDDRLNRHKRLGWEVLEVRGPMDGHLTQQCETAILRMLKAKGADLSNDKIAGKFDGYSEAWSKSTFPVDSIKDLMHLTEEFEDSKNGD